MSFTVTDFHSLIRLLEANPEWRAQLLRVLFPEAFLDLPRAMKALAEAQRRTEAALDRLTERMERGFAEAARERAEAAADRQRIWQAIRESNERMEKGFAEAARERARIAAEAATDRSLIRKDIRDIREDVRDMKGESRELYYRHRATGIFGRWLRGGHEATGEVADRLQTVLQEGRISDREYTQVLASDLLWAGKLRETGEAVVLVIEASWWVGPTDVERAAERAGVLRRAGLKALPVAAGKEWPDDVKDLAREEKVVVVQDGSLDSASWQVALDVA